MDNTESKAIVQGNAIDRIMQSAIIVAVIFFALIMLLFVILFIGQAWEETVYCITQVMSYIQSLIS